MMDELHKETHTIAEQMVELPSPATVDDPKKEANQN